MRRKAFSNLNDTLATTTPTPASAPGLHRRRTPPVHAEDPPQRLHRATVRPNVRPGRGHEDGDAVHLTASVWMNTRTYLKGLEQPRASPARRL